MGAAPTSRARVVLAVHRAVLRTGRTPVGRVWSLAHRLIARAVLAYVVRREPAAGYLRGSVGTRDFVAGLSDIDLAVVVAGTRGNGGARARRRRDRLARAPTAQLLVDGPMIFEETDLRDLAGTSALTYGLDGTGGPALHDAAYFGEHADFDWLRMLERPGLQGAHADWRLISGRDRRSREPAPDRQRSAFSVARADVPLALGLPAVRRLERASRVQPVREAGRRVGAHLALPGSRRAGTGGGRMRCGAPCPGCRRRSMRCAGRSNCTRRSRVLPIRH